MMKDLISHDSMILAKSEQGQLGSAHVHSQCVELAALGLAKGEGLAAAKVPGFQE